MMSNNGAVNGAVRGAVKGAVYRDVDWAVFWAVDLAVWDTVVGDMHTAVFQSLSDPEHPALRDFLRSAERVCATGK